MSVTSNATPAVPRPRTDAEPATPATQAGPADRLARGEARRREVPLSALAEVHREAGGVDTVTLLEEQASDRLPELVPIRYGRMLASPFAFYRGAARIMARDLAGGPRSELAVQMGGDAHAANFGLFGSPERRLVFDANDFDETLPGPFEFDVKRLIASLAVTARGMAVKTKERRAIARAVAARYRGAMHQFADMGDLDVWYAHVDEAAVRERILPLIDSKRRKRLTKVLDKARTRDSAQVFGKLAEVTDGRLGIRPEPPLIVPLSDLMTVEAGEDLHERFQALIGQYRRTLQSDRRALLERYRFVDMARKVVGVGSVGTRCWIVLLTGRDDNDPLFLQIKEAAPSVHAEYLGRSAYANQGERVVAGQRLVQQSSDIFLGWQRTHGIDGVQRDFYVRQLRDWKGSIEIESLRPEGLQIYGELCAWSLARAHARSGDRFAISGYLGFSEEFDVALAEFAEAYADLNDDDHRALGRAAATGRVTAELGV